MMRPSVVCLMGPTASGKTALALTLAEKLPVNIVSVDSALVYRGLDIGAAKPSANELKKTPHKLINIRNPDEPYSAADFCADATKAIHEIMAKDRVPLLVGGTMLYFKALQEGLSDLPQANKEVREEILTVAASKGWEVMHQKLAKIDPASAAKIKPSDSQRIQRALEVYQLTGKPLSALQQQKSAAKFRFINIGLMPSDRQALRERIAERFKLMLDQGLVAEVKALTEGYGNQVNLPAFRAVGYRQVLAYLNGECDYETMVSQAITATRQLAKRQLTWLRRWPNLKTFAAESVRVDEVVNFIHQSMLST